MLSRRTFTLAGLAWTATGCGLRADVDRVRLGLASSHSHSRLEALAAKERALRIDATTDQQGVEDLLESFEHLYPAIAIEYHRPPSSRLLDDFLEAATSGRPTADIVISSAMDLQFKLVNDGFAQTYESPEKSNLPAWAVWKDQAYAITAEPIVFIYNRALMPPADVPGSHDELADLLRRKPDEYRGKIATYDPERSGTGYLYYTQDLLLSRDTLDLAEAVGRTNPKFYVAGADLINKVASGEHVLAYNMVSSYLLDRQPRFSNIGMVYPSDYTLVMSRIAIIPKTARHPAASKLFLDFLLSEVGQGLLARHYMRPIRTGIAMGGPVPPPEVLRPIHFGPALLANLDEFRRRRVLREWHRTLES
jgi:iron(III) transport system substrate-binding protein